MYAPIERRQIYGLPMEFAKLEWLEKRLKNLHAKYQLVILRRMFDVAFMEEFQFTLISWENNPTVWEKKRTVLLETHDIQQMASVLKMLISVEGEDAKNRS